LGRQKYTIFSYKIIEKFILLNFFMQYFFTELNIQKIANSGFLTHKICFYFSAIDIFCTFAEK